jgi:hypothetical protein
VEVLLEVTPTPEATIDAQSETTPAPDATPSEMCPNEMCQNGKCLATVVSNSSDLQVGDTLTLTAKFCCFDCCEYELNWQVKTKKWQLGKYQLRTWQDTDDQTGRPKHRLPVARRDCDLGSPQRGP